ncbi:hypothetical protein ABBQ32_011445 [Trebouxia sp. C0010 RCD-2024]
MGLLKQNSPPSAQQDVKDEADDIDFMEEDPEEESTVIADDLPSGPRSWEEVEENESQRVSLNISSHAVPSNDSGEAAARLAWQAAALEAENQDPLGLGRIDAHGLRLVRQDRFASKPGGARRNDNLLRRGGNLRRGTKEVADEAVRTAVAKPLLDLSGNLSEYRQQVMPTQDSFEPMLYLAIMHGETSLSDLKTGRQNLSFEVSERTGQLKDLVKENFERFISCKSTIDDIHVRLRKAEGDYGDGADGASTADMVAAVTDVQEEARHANASMLERATMSDRIKSVMGLIRRYESLFQLPTRIVQETERGEFETVVSEYRKARAIMADVTSRNATEGPGEGLADSTTKGIWHSIFLEVDKGADLMIGKLTNSLRMPNVSSRQAADAIKHLLHLQAEGARSARNLNPVKLYLEAQAGHVSQLFASAADKHAAAMRGVQEQASAEADSDAQWLRNSSQEDLAAVPPADAQQERLQHAPASAIATQEETLWLQLLAKMTGHVVAHLPKIWQLVQEHLGAFSSISKQAQSIVSGAASLATQLLQGVMADYSARVIAALQQMGSASTSSKSFLAAVRLVANGCQQAFEVAELPGLLSALTKVLQEAGRVCVSEMTASCAAASMAQPSMQQAAFWSAQSSQGGFGTAADPFSRALCSSLAQLRAVYAEAEHAGISLEMLSKELRTALQGCFFTFVLRTREAAGLVPVSAAQSEEEQQDQAQQPVAPVTDAALLMLHARCAHVSSSLLVHAFSRYESCLAADGQPEQVQSVSDQCAEELQQVGYDIMTAYIQSKTCQLDTVLEALFQDTAAWPQAPPPTHLRDACLEVVYTLTGVRAEGQPLQMPQRQEVLQSLLQHTLMRFQKALLTTLQDLSTGGLLQLLLELQYLHAASTVYVSTRLEQSFADIGALLTKQIQDAQELQGRSDQLSCWMSQAQGSDLLECMQARLAQVLTLCSTSQQLNLRVLQQ